MYVYGKMSKELIVTPRGVFAFFANIPNLRARNRLKRGWEPNILKEVVRGPKAL